ncbi:MarR family winged helix-turn-helix transcriptional regulator [Streptomyces sp. NPDC048507]|uniref:MarR family winged helix-turn-helix transcriptional regulator n=1 Tax=Streptomyces sp. NPDC048507 TaxID=3365560 RepID=UPI003712B21F
MDDADAVIRALYAASQVLVAVSARSLAAAGAKVTLAQFRMLVVLATRGAAKLVALAEAMGVNPSTAMRMVDRLIAVGLADRRPNPDDRRETILTVTRGGLRLVEEVTARRREEIAAIAARIEPGERSALLGALSAFGAAGAGPVAPEGEEPLFPLG